MSFLRIGHHKKRRIQKKIPNTNRWAKYDSKTGDFISAKRGNPYKNIKILYKTNSFLSQVSLAWHITDDEEIISDETVLRRVSDKILND